MATELRHSAFLGHQQRRTWLCHARGDFGDPQSRTFGHAARGCSSGSKSFPPFVLWWIHIYYTAAPSSKSCKVRHVFFFKLWQEIMHPAYLAWFVCWVMMKIMSLQLANSEHGRTFLLNWSIVVFSMYDARKHVMLFQHTYICHAQHVQVSRQSAP